MPAWVPTSELRALRRPDSGSSRSPTRASTDAVELRRAQDVRWEGGVIMRHFEYRVIDTGKDIEARLNELGTDGWQVVGVTTRKQLLIAPPAAIILMRELEPAAVRAA